ETQMAGVRLGQSVNFTVDALDDQTMHGRVQRISPAAGSEFSLLPADNATGNFVKISQRIPVRIIVDDNQPLLERLRPGMSVVVSIDTSAEGDVPPDPF
uniref:HlyD family secretion protein n=1 Tax=Pseudomonas viridiflava TaxID=33069 RepID=UPI0013DAA105